MKKTIKKLTILFLTMSMVFTLVACGGDTTDTDQGTSGDSVDDAGSTEDGATIEEDEAAEDEGIISTVGNPDGEHLEFWLFAELHAQFYAEMLEQWNENNPDKQLQITFTTYPFSDMHNKLMLAIQTGKGAPDLVDIEINQFPNFLKGDVAFLPMNEYVAPYEEDIVQSRLDSYGKDGTYYGMPTHVGATVMYYNVDMLETYGIDYTTLVTWDDFTEAGKKLYEESNGDHYMTSVDSGQTDWLWLTMAQHNDDWTDDSGEVANVQLESISKMLKMQQGWLEEDVAMISPDGHVDLEAGFANISDGGIASFPKALWYMSRFVNYMPEMEGKWAIAPAPVFEEGQDRSVGIGGTGTTVLNLSDNENVELAAEFIAWTKLSYDGNVGIWEVLGFDPCNMEVWTNPEITQDETNEYINYFVSNPFDVMNEISDEIKMIKVTGLTPTIHEVFNTQILNDILEDGMDVDSALEEAQSMIELEY